MPKVNYNIKKINQLRQKYYLASKGKQGLLAILAENEIGEQVYNSNAIENSTLTLEETEKILLNLDLNRFISERELHEAKNLAAVTNYINNKALSSPLNLDMILLLHKMLMTNIQPEIARRFRQDTEWVRVGSHIASDPKQVKAEVEKLLLTYQVSFDIDVVKRVSALHLQFEHIHPFVDGNGRVGRVLINYILLREGYVPINIKFVDKDKYYQALYEYDNFKDTKAMENLIYLSLTNSYHKRLAYLEGKRIINLKDYAKLAKTSHSNILNKAKRQTIEAFLQKGKWQIGV